jgi:6-phosphofructokinase
MKVLVAQGGGPTAVINHSLVGLVLASRRFSKIEDVYGSRHGVAGIPCGQKIKTAGKTRGYPIPA